MKILKSIIISTVALMSISVPVLTANAKTNTKIQKAEKITPYYGKYAQFNHKNITYYLQSKNKYYNNIWKSAIKSWNKSRCVKLTRTSNYHKANIILNIKTWGDNYTVNETGATYRIYGKYYQKKTYSYLLTKAMDINSYSKYEKTVVAAHEIGHALGLKHSSYSNSVMNPRASEFMPQPPDYRAIHKMYSNKKFNIKSN